MSFIVVVVVVVVLPPTIILHSVKNPYLISLTSSLCFLSIRLLLVACFVCFVVSPPQKNGKKPIDVAKTEVRRDLVTFYLPLHSSHLPSTHFYFYPYVYLFILL
jgi:hypothetical protein